MAKYRVYLPDLPYYQQNVSCQSACPVRTDGRAYVNAIARGEYERAYLIARETNPFASTCGWVCGAPCEAACRRGKIDAPIAIRALKRFVNDRYGVFLGAPGAAPAPPASAPCPPAPPAGGATALASASPSPARGQPDSRAHTTWPSSGTRSSCSTRPRPRGACCASASPNIASRVS